MRQDTALGHRVLGPLVADLAPPHLLGRYIAVFSLMVTGGFAIGPAIGGVVLAYSPNAGWWGGALVAGVIGAGALLARTVEIAQP